MSHQPPQALMLCSLDTENRAILQDGWEVTELQQEGDDVPGGSSGMEVQIPVGAGGGRQLAAARFLG